MRIRGSSSTTSRGPNLRVTEGQFAQELLREHGITVGSAWTRASRALTLDVLGKEAAYDPQSAAISAAYTGAFSTTTTATSKFPKDKTYAISGHVYPDGTSSTRPRGGPSRFPDRRTRART